LLLVLAVIGWLELAPPLLRSPCAASVALRNDAVLLALLMDAGCDAVAIDRTALAPPACG
jgi:hypothetical protein